LPRFSRLIEGKGKSLADGSILLFLNLAFLVLRAGSAFKFLY